MLAEHCTGEEGRGAWRGLGLNTPPLDPPIDVDGDSEDEPHEPMNAFDDNPPRSTLDENAYLMQQSIAPELIKPYTNALKSLSRMGKLQFGTIFSGCDITSHVIQSLVWAIASIFDIVLVLESLFICEKDALKRTFLTNEFPDTPILVDVLAGLVTIFNFYSIFELCWGSGTRPDRQISIVRFVLYSFQPKSFSGCRDTAILVSTLKIFYFYCGDKTS